MGITLKELSEISGYSIATISRVLSNKGNVKPETREAVKKLLMEYQYRTNIMDLREAEQRRDKVMILIGDLNNYYYTELTRILQTQLLQAGYPSLIAFTDNQSQLEAEYVKMALQDGFAGLLFINVRGGNELAEYLKNVQIPVVFINRGIRFADFDEVISDNYQGGYMITSYLIEMGHKKIGHLMGYMYSSTAQERRRGYEDAMRSAKLPVTNNSVYAGRLDYGSGYSYGEYLVKKGLDFTAVFCGNDLMAIGLIKALEDYGVRVPDQISVVCYDETLLAQNAGLTTIGAEPEKLAAKAAEILVRKMEGEDDKNQGVTLFRPRIIHRNSVKQLHKM